MRRAMATSLWRVLDDPDAAGVHGAAVPAGGRRRRSVGRTEPVVTEAGLSRWPPRISLALTLHNHQPVGNFGWVIAEVFEQAYQPMVEALERHPGVRLSLHYTGPAARAGSGPSGPSSSTASRALVERDQVEILGGGWYEPVLAALPERDRVGQLVRMADELEATVRAAAARRVARRAGLGAGPADRRSSPPATTGRSSTTPTSGPPRSPRTSSGARTRPTTRARS